MSHPPRACPRACSSREATDSGGGAAATPPVAAAAASECATTPAVAMSRCTYNDLFSEYPRQDPRVPGSEPPNLGRSSKTCVLQGSVGSRPAAVKIIDLWRLDKEVLQVGTVGYRSSKGVADSSGLRAAHRGWSTQHPYQPDSRSLAACGPIAGACATNERVSVAGVGPNSQVLG